MIPFFIFFFLKKTSILVLEIKLIMEASADQILMIYLQKRNIGLGQQLI